MIDRETAEYRYLIEEWADLPHSPPLLQPCQRIR